MTKNKPVESTPKAARRTAVFMLGRRSYASARLLEKLMEKGYTQADARAAVDWCIEQRYLDDHALALRLAEQQTQRGYGKRRIGDSLRSKGFDPDLCQQVAQELEEAAEPEERRARIIVLCRKLHKGETWDQREKARLSAALARRGFGWEDIHAALRAVTEE